MKRWLLTVCLAFACGGERPISDRPAPVPDAVAPVLGGEARSARIANYQIRARLDAGTRRITAEQTLRWTNTGREPVASLPFHLYLNGFKNESSLFMRSSGGSHRGEVASDDAWGWIDVADITVDGAAAAAEHVGPDETVLEVATAAPIEPGATVEIAMRFSAQLPEVFARTGYKGAFIMVGQWFPKIGVRIDAADGERWHCEPFHVNSEFFADFGTYDVELTVPRTHVVAATGVLTAARDGDDGTRTLTYRAEDVHDFAWMADPWMQVISGTARTELGEVEVRVYHRPEQAAFARRHLRAGIGSIEHFSALYVPYPWPIMSIIDPPPEAMGSAGGMEYPTLVTTAGDLVVTPPGVRLPEFVTVHEVGHNWFQGILASNEVEEAWLDEGVNEYADGLVMAAIYGDDANLIDYLGWSADTLQARRIEDIASLPAPIATRAPAFPDGEAYAGASYAKTALALATLENIVGRERFRAAMKSYATTWAFRHPTGRDLWASLEASLGEDLSWFVEPVFYGRGVVDHRVRSIRCRARREPAGVFGAGDQRRTVARSSQNDTRVCVVVVANLGDVPVPVDIELRFADGTRARERWDGRSPWHELRTEHTADVSAVVIDPDRTILIDVAYLASGKRREPDTTATRAAGARVQFWTQSLMQLGGL